MITVMINKWCVG